MRNTCGEMLRFRTELDFFRAFVWKRWNYSAKHKRVSKVMNASTDFRSYHFSQTQKINKSHVTQCNVNDKCVGIGDQRSGGTNRENNFPERTGDLQSVKTILTNVRDFRHQHISSWLTEGMLNKLCESYACLSDDKKNVFLGELTEGSISQQLWLFYQIGKMKGGAGYLVYLREDLLNLISKKKDERGGCPKLHDLNATLRELLSVWFSQDFLELERITWKSSSEILEKISKYERVHPVRNRTDLRRRLGPYRRCFVFLHRSMPGEPIIILHVALTDKITSCLTDLLPQDVDSPQLTGSNDTVDTCDDPGEDHTKIKAAVFYSLSLAQKGLSGIGASYYLMRRVGEKLQSEFPGVTQFSTLSPIHNFKVWLLRKIETVKSGRNDILFPDEVERLQDYFSHSSYLEQLYKVLSTNSWILQESLRDFLREPLMRLCSRYLYLEKTARGYAADGAANLHLKNGAVMWRINWRANPYPRGLNSSLGLMVNYRYYFDEMELHGKEYQEEKKITASEEIIELVKSAEMLMLNPLVKSKI